MSPVPAVVVDHVSKTFRIPREQVHTLKEKALHPFRRTEYEMLRALREVSFSVEPGEFFGIVGRNGSGKSTLLKCLAGIYRADRGRIYINGRLSTFIELGVGFNPDLAAFDNVVLNATMLGLSPREARRRFDRIIEFAELGDFVELKLKNYSSGMMVRLAFAVMIQVDAEILLIDEVLAVGDAAFQQKCFDEFARIRRGGVTVLFVTHEMGSVQRFCDRALLLEQGRIADLGDTEYVADRYLQLNFSREAREEEHRQAARQEAADGETVNNVEEIAAERAAAPEPEHEPVRLTDGSAEILEAWLEDDEGERTDVLHNRMPCTFRARVRFHQPQEHPLFGVLFQDAQGNPVWGANNVQGPKSGSFDAGEEIVYSFRFENLLAAGRYWVTPGMLPATGGVAWLDRRSRLLSVMVTSARDPAGVVDLPFEFAVERRREAQSSPQEVAG
jgi:ABC-type polysaccharide/polyol phosphate transport system ATPase subunit